MLFGVLIAALWLVPRTRSPRQIAAGALLLGGAVGNLVDRVVWGTVRDFLPLGPVVANLADLAVLTGLLLTLTSTWNPEHPSDDRPNPSLTERR